MQGSSPHLRNAIDHWGESHDLADRLQPYAAHACTTPVASCSTLHLEDVSAIPFLTDIVGVTEYQHRARVRAGTGDLVVTVTPHDPRYEVYCRDTLGLGAPVCMTVAPADDRLAVARTCRSAGVFDSLVDHVRKVGSLIIHPYMSIEEVWQLAADLARESRCSVQVLGPPPPVTWIANDKAHFMDLVTLVLGEGWIPETRCGSDPDRLAFLLQDMAHRHGRIGLKRTRCASAMGNLVLDGSELRTRPTASVRQIVTDFLSATEWNGDEPVLAVAWESAVSSPSTQWWIPSPDVGLPRLDGIYEQILDGERGLFVGSCPSQLPERVHRVLADAAARVAQALQRIGYIGRCSFDHLVLGDTDGDFIIRFTECNGRWGGTSTPMHLVDRVVRGPRPPYRAQDFVHPQLASLAIADILERVEPECFDVHRQAGRFIFYNVGPLAECGKLDVIALGETPAVAEHALLDDLPRRLGL